MGTRIRDKSIKKRNFFSKMLRKTRREFDEANRRVSEPVKETIIKTLIQRGTLMKTLANLYKRYDIKIEFFLSRHKSKSQSWSNLIHLTCEGNNEKIGDRIPGIWFFPGHDRLHIRTAVGDNKNGGVNGSRPLKLGLTKIHISQKPDANGTWCFSVVVDNDGEKKMYKCCQGTPRDFQDVKVYVSNPWHEAADNAHILSLEVQTEPEDCVKQFTVFYDSVVKAISVDGKMYGTVYPPFKMKKIKLAPGEKITKVRYRHQSFFIWKSMCHLEFFSNRNKKYGPFGDARTDEPYFTVNLQGDWSKAINKVYGTINGFINV